MIPLTDKVKQVTLKSGDVAKLTVLFKTTSFYNTGTQQAVIQSSKDGYTWKPLTIIESGSTIPLKLDADTIYIRLISSTTVQMTGNTPILRNQAPDEISINLPSLAIKDELSSYVKKSELNSLVTHPDTSNLVTHKQVQDMLPTIPPQPNLSIYATKTELGTKADMDTVQANIDALNTKADKSELQKLSTAHELISQTLLHLQDIKADKATVQSTIELVSSLIEAINNYRTLVTGVESSVSSKASLEQLELTRNQLIDSIADKASQAQLIELTNTVKTKANQQLVDSIYNIVLGLQQDKANKLEFDTLRNQVKLIKGIMTNDDDEIDFSPFVVKSTNLVLQKMPELLQNSQAVQELKDSVATSTQQNSAQVKQLSDTLQVQQEALQQKLDEAQVKALIATAELDDLTLEQVQTQIIQAVADKAAAQAVDEANRLQDERINTKADISTVQDVKIGLQDLESKLQGQIATKMDNSKLSSLATKEELDTKADFDEVQMLKVRVDDINIPDVQPIKDELDSLSAQLSTKVADAALQASLATKVDTQTFNERVQALEQRPTEVQWDTVQGKPTRFQPMAHVHNTWEILGLDNALANKAPLSHTHAVTDITGLQEMIAQATPSLQFTAGKGLTGSIDSSTSGTFSLGTPSKITATSTNNVFNQTHSHEIDKATVDTAGIVQLSHATNGTDKTKAASEFALGEVRRMANQAQVTANGIALTWNDIQNKPRDFTPSAHTHAFNQITSVPTANTTTAGIVQLNNSLTSTSQTQALTAGMGKALKDEINAISANKMTLRGTLGTTDLNTLNATNSTGIWHQTHDANATTARSYPVNQAGTLWVLPAAYTGQQIYIPYSQDTIYKRTSTRTGGWESWQSFNATLPTQTHGLVTATAATGTVNTPTNNNNTFLNIVTNTAGQASSTGSSTQITGTNGITVSSDARGKLIISQDATNTAPTSLARARRISITGATSGSAMFDGSSDIEIATSINSMYFNSLLSQNGYQKLPSGLILQWGSSPANLFITFPISFPTAVLNINAVPQSNQHSVPDSRVYGIDGAGPMNFRIYSLTRENDRFYWIAIGH